jgi:hypothetical protein
MQRALLKSLGSTSALTPTKTSAHTTAKSCTQNNDHTTFSIFKIIAFIFLLCSSATITGAAIYPTLLRRKVIKGEVMEGWAVRASRYLQAPTAFICKLLEAMRDRYGMHTDEVRSRG